MLLLVSFVLAADVPPLGEFIPQFGGSLPVMSTDGRRLAWVGDRIRVAPDGEVPPETRGVPNAWASPDVLVVRGWPSTWTLVDVTRGVSVSVEGIRDLDVPLPGRIAILGSLNTTQLTELQTMGLVVDTIEDRRATALIVGDDGIVGAIRRVGRLDYIRADASFMWPTTAWARDRTWHLRRPWSTAFVGDFRLLSRAFGDALLALDGQTWGNTTLASIGLGTGKTKALFDPPARGAVAAVLQSPTTGQPLAVAVRAEQLTWQAMSPEVDQDLAAIAGALPDDDWFPQVSSDLSEWLVYTTGPTHGYRAYRYTRATGEVQRVDHFSREARPFRPTTPVTWAAPDGQVVGAYLTTPDSSAFGAGPWPMVVLAHGGPSSGRYLWGWSFEAQRLTALGIAVLAVNYRGSDGFGRAYANADGREDITEAIRRQVDAGVADLDRIAMMGAS